MANTAKAITSDAVSSATGARIIRGTLGADGTLTIGEGFEHAQHVSIQLTGTFNSSVQTVLVSNDGTNFVAPATAVSFSAAALKCIALADLGFRHLQFSGASAGGSSNIAFTVVIASEDD
jgi:hypothetical protein